jgi:hypothetical protein
LAKLQQRLPQRIWLAINTLQALSRTVHFQTVLIKAPIHNPECMLKHNTQAHVLIRHTRLQKTTTLDEQSATLIGQT